MAEEKKWIGTMPPGTKVVSEKAQYRVLQPLGQGGFGITYKVVRLTDGKVLAMKEYYRKELCQRRPDDTISYFDTNKETIETGLEDFITEARRLSRQNISHPNIVGIEETFRANNTAYYLMEYVEGEDLLRYMQRRKNAPLSTEQALSVMRPLLQAVALLHNHRITHLDIKHENILLTRRDDGSLRPVLIDFGLSKHYDKKGKATSTLTAAGCTDGFAPPEQYQGLTTFTPQADVYALAATLLFLLTGKWPMKSSLVTAGRLLEILPSELPQPFKDAIIHAMRKDADDRTPTVEAFAYDLGLDITSGANETRLLDPHKKPRRAANFKRLLRPALFVAAAATVALGGSFAVKQCSKPQAIEEERFDDENPTDSVAPLTDNSDNISEESLPEEKPQAAKTEAGTAASSGKTGEAVESRPGKDPDPAKPTGAERVRNASSIAEMRSLANEGVREAYAPLANMELGAGNYDNAAKWARKAGSAGQPVIRQLEELGYLETAAPKFN